MKTRVHVPDEWNRITACVIGCAMAVYKGLGPGLAEVLDERAMGTEFDARSIPFSRQHRCAVTYRRHRIGDQVLDLVGCDAVVIELKSTENVGHHHLAQLMGSMRAADLPLGLLINFNSLPPEDGIFRTPKPASSMFTHHSPLSVPSAPLRTSL